MSKRRESMKNEKRVADKFNANVNLASGSLWFLKGDIRLPLYLIEDKMTAKEYYILKLKTWYKIEKEALKDGFRTPLMVLTLEDGKSVLGVVDYHYLKFLVKEREEEVILNTVTEEIEHKSFRVRDFDIGIEDLSEEEIEGLEDNALYIEAKVLDFKEETELAILDANSLAYLIDEEG